MKNRSRGLLSLSVALIVLRIVVGVAAWEPGWSALTWDDFSRVLQAQQWAADPYFVNDLVWLPGQTWFAGIIYAGFGNLFAGSPMALMAIINTSAIVAASALAAWSAWMLYRSTLGTVMVLAAVLFSPWGFFTSLSGLNEPLYYLAVTGAIAGFVRWMSSDRLVPLVASGLAMAAACTLRYEGWWLAAGWAATVWWRRWRTSGNGPIAAIIRLAPFVAIPFLVPLWWFLLNYSRTGDPLHFARESARIFLSAYGNDLFDSIPERITYYPFSAIRSAPVLLLLIAAMLYFQRDDQRVRRLAMVPILAFIPFYGTSLLSPAVGAFNERFMFAFVLALAPIVGGLPAVWRSLPSRRALRVVAVAMTGIFVTVTVFRVLDRPIEWTHAPDLLALNESLGNAAVEEDPLTVVLGDGLSVASIPLTVQNGSRVKLISASELGLSSPADLPSSADVWVEALPARVLDFEEPADAAIGRYHLWWTSEEPPLDTGPSESGKWTLTTEMGKVLPLASAFFTPLEFVSDDPPPGSRAFLRHAFEQQPEATRGEIKLRWLYGHGFNMGRIHLEILVDGSEVWSTDIAERSRWVNIDFEIPPGNGESILEVAVVASTGIESGWGWGRASTVLIDDLIIDRP